MIANGHHFNFFLSHANIYKPRRKFYILVAPTVYFIVVPIYFYKVTSPKGSVASAYIVGTAAFFNNQWRQKRHSQRINPVFNVGRERKYPPYSSFAKLLAAFFI